MKILIADKFPRFACPLLRELGHHVDLRASLDGSEVPAALASSAADVLIVRSTKVTAKAFEASGNLSLVIRAGAGVNTIDREAASRHGVFVANCAGKNAIAVAELVFGLLLALDRQIPDAAADLKAGRWNKKKYGKGGGLHGKRLGLVGLGAVAREVATRGLAFGLKVQAYSVRADPDLASRLGISLCDSLDALLRTSDVVSIHVPYGEKTRHLIGERQLARMREGAILIHTARGGVVDDSALAHAVRSGRIRAGVDVFEGEPSGGDAEVDLELPGLAGCYATPHIGASTAQAESAIADEVVRIVRDFGGRGVVHNTVNVVTDRPACCSLVVRHLDRVGVLAGVLDALRRDHFNVQEMQNIVFAGEKAAACATITLEREPGAELLDKLRAHDDVLAVDLRAAGDSRGAVEIRGDG
ncbi:MAG: NAD(P)-dependent oxidoreductase [Nannocystaceae bacterium]